MAEAAGGRSWTSSLSHPVTRGPPRRLPLPAFAGVPVGEAAAGVQVPPGLIVCDCSHPALGRGWRAVFAQTPAAADIKLQSDTTPRALTVESASSFSLKLAREELGGKTRLTAVVHSVVFGSL